jgi:hypothetical protein
MWDLEIMNQISSLKEKKINILQIGFYKNEESLWLLQNIMKNKNSKLYILNTWYQLAYNTNIMDNQYSNKNIIEKDFFKDLITYSDQYFNIKQKTEVAFQYFQKEKILFNIILIHLDNIKDILAYLISTWNILEIDGFLILSYQYKLISEIEKNIKIFVKIYNKNIKIIQFDKYYFIKKISKNNIISDIPIYIEQIALKYVKDNPFNYIEILPNINTENINWNFILSNNYVIATKKYGYNNQIERYYNYIDYVSITWLTAGLMNQICSWCSNSLSTVTL